MDVGFAGDPLVKYAHAMGMSIIYNAMRDKNFLPAEKTVKFIQSSLHPSAPATVLASRTGGCYLRASASVRQYLGYATSQRGPFGGIGQ